MANAIQLSFLDRNYVELPAASARRLEAMLRRSSAPAADRLANLLDAALRKEIPATVEVNDSERRLVIELLEEEMLEVPLRQLWHEMREQ